MATSCGGPCSAEGLPRGTWRPLWPSMGGSWGPLGHVLGALWPSWRLLEASSRRLGGSWALLETSWALLQASWSRPGGVLGAPRAVWEASWGPGSGHLQAPEALGAAISRLQRLLRPTWLQPQFSRVFSSRQSSASPLGAVWRPLGALLDGFVALRAVWRTPVKVHEAQVEVHKAQVGATRAVVDPM